MKAKEKRVGTKAKVKALKEREKHIATAIFLVFILLIVIFSAYLTYTYLNKSPNQAINPSASFKAAIVDQLSLTAPNHTFIEKATNTLKQAGYTVDYHAGERVTVEFYRNLPTHGYSLIILRAHSTAKYGQLFTSEPYSSQRYVIEQLDDQIIRVSFYQNEPPFYFAVSPYFVIRSMKGRFSDTLILMMGCDGLKNTNMAEAFVKKGAKVYVGWNESVLASHTDTATTLLLQHLLTEKQTIRQAVENTMEEVGPDPTYKSQLIYYPHKAGDHILEDITGNPTTKP